VQTQSYLRSGLREFIRCDARQDAFDLTMMAYPGWPRELHDVRRPDEGNALVLGCRKKASYRRVALRRQVAQFIEYIRKRLQYRSDT
jgi:hypothetical protein